ncbi:DNA-binding response regulator [Taibaiella sp. KBW10]|uniref:response regulator transcription factor n=1 Tax=Taibaiella sp. KBW10 TaxID=2153357 RepID=UPI000F5B3925|nr:response regulator transcription factor [Taibaiella sp. KBW10]RQO29962.1 DNA-binding response regulator [Taibaiella sp. KBW10]
MNAKYTNVAIVDDHALFRKGLKMLINNIAHHEVTMEAANGQLFIEALQPDKLPDIVLLDIRMPELDGYDTAGWLSEHYPQVAILALSTMDDEAAIIKMIQKGAKGYVLKNAETDELHKAIKSVLEQGYFYNNHITHKVISTIGGVMNGSSTIATIINLTEREKEFLKLVCTELSYAEIAKCMFLSPRTIDGYREALFEKFQVKSRVGLVLYAIKRGIVIL